jgi:hypothetical protein
VHSRHPLAPSGLLTYAQNGKLLKRFKLICPTGRQAIFLSSPICKNISLRA